MSEIKDQDLQQIEKMLNTAIRNLLYGGSTDPDWGECAGAAVCFKTLKILKLNIEEEDEVREELSNPQMNLWHENFLKPYDL